LDADGLNGVDLVDLFADQITGEDCVDWALFQESTAELVALDVFGSVGRMRHVEDG